MSQVEQAPHHEEEHHVTDRQYVNIAIILGIVTALEVGIYYVKALEDFLVPFLMAFAGVKFVMVVAWFMHLKFDSRLFRRLFVTGIILAVIVFAVALTTFFARGGAAPQAG